MDSIVPIVVALIYATTQIILTIYSANKANAAKKQAVVATDIAAEVSESVGPKNGATIRDLLQEIRDFQEYQHKRNHDMINMLVASNARQDMIGIKLGIEMPNKEKLLPLMEEAATNYETHYGNTEQN